MSIEDYRNLRLRVERALKEHGVDPIIWDTSISIEEATKNMLTHIKRMKNVITSCDNTTDSSKRRMEYYLDHAASLVMQLLENSNDTFKHLEDRIEEAKNSQKEETEYDMKMNPMSMSIIIKYDLNNDFLEEITQYMKTVKINFIQFIDTDKIFISFGIFLECLAFTDILKYKYPAVKIYKEKMRDVDVVFHDVEGLSLENLEKKIEKITDEKPFHMTTIEYSQEGHSVVIARLTTLSFLKLEAQNEETITVKGVRYEYTVLHESIYESSEL